VLSPPAPPTPQLELLFSGDLGDNRLWEGRHRIALYALYALSCPSTQVAPLLTQPKHILLDEPSA